MKRKLRIVRIVEEYFAPYSHVLSDEDLEYVMDFVKVILIKKGKYKPRIR